MKLGDEASSELFRLGVTTGRTDERSCQDRRCFLG